MSYRLPIAIAAFILSSTIVVAVVIIASHGTAGRPVPPTLPPARSAFPAPPRGAVVFAREMGADALALGVVAGNPLVLQASIVDRQGRGVSGREVAFSVLHGGDVFVRAHAAKACGPGCYRASVGVAHPQSVNVDVRGAGARTSWHVAMPRTWPPPDASKLVARADRAWRHLRTLAFHERIASDPRHEVVSSWKMVAPDRLAYVIERGSSAVIIGTTRWDTVNGVWRKSAALRLQQPQPFWDAVSDAHVLGSATLHGRAVWHVSFFDPSSQAWFELAIDKRTAWTRDLHMVTTAHFMHDVYGQFNGPIAIRPPR